GARKPQRFRACQPPIAASAGPSPTAYPRRLPATPSSVPDAAATWAIGMRQCCQREKYVSSPDHFATGPDFLASSSFSLPGAGLEKSGTAVATADAASTDTIRK